MGLTSLVSCDIMGCVAGDDEANTSQIRPKNPHRLPKRIVDYGLLAQLVEHIVHIDGVTGSSPVQTTKKPPNMDGFLLHI